MIIGDSLEKPKEKRGYLRLSAKDLLRNHRRRTFHMREDGGGLVAAEGEAVEFTLPPTCTGVAALPGKVAGHSPVKNYIYFMKADKSGYDRVYASAVPPYRLIRYYDTQGAEQIVCVTENNVESYVGTSTLHVGIGKGGCGAIFHDRVFTAKGERVQYSAPMKISEWNYSRNGAGYLDLPWDEGGSILGMQPYKDKLYLFRRHGITCLRVLGDELNMKAVHLPLKYGKLIPESVALCGEKVGYFTDKGLCLFNGAVSELAGNSRCDEIDFSRTVKSLAHCGRYFSLVTRKEGGKAIYCYDPEQGEAYFIENGAVDIASGDELYFSRGTLAYRLTERGVPENFTPYFTAENVAFGSGGEKMLRSVAVEGKGAFSVSVSSKRGSRTVRGNANEILKLRSPLRGNAFDLKISVDPAQADSARFCAVLFRFTEEENDD